MGSPLTENQPGAAEDLCEPAEMGAEETVGSPGERFTLPAVGLQRPHHADGPVGLLSPTCVEQPDWL